MDAGAQAVPAQMDTQPTRIFYMDGGKIWRERQNKCVAVSGREHVADCRVLHSSLGTTEGLMHVRPVEAQSSHVHLVQKPKVAAVAEWYRYRTVACLSRVKPSTTKDPPYRAAMHIKSVES
ncbi:hypothetical protein TNCV_4320221 [Trichonephila clavipes]|nr:hypothetical protein TNCV_4320221 [Trichonephila clavipes]